LQSPVQIMLPGEQAPQVAWFVPEIATTVLCTPDDGRDRRPKHVE